MHQLSRKRMLELIYSLEVQSPSGYLLQVVWALPLQTIHRVNNPNPKHNTLSQPSVEYVVPGHYLWVICFLVGQYLFPTTKLT